MANAGRHPIGVLTIVGKSPSKPPATKLHPISGERFCGNYLFVTRNGGARLFPRIARPVTTRFGFDFVSQYLINFQGCRGDLSALVGAVVACRGWIASCDRPLRGGQGAVGSLHQLPMGDSKEDRQQDREREREREVSCPVGGCLAKDCLAWALTTMDSG
jgi:hypothetical protein